MTDKQLLKTVTSFRKGILGKRGPELMCFAICSPLAGYLSMFGFETELIQGGIDGIWCNHTWLKLPDGRILDPTASQFNNDDKPERIMPEVYLGNRPEWYLDYVWGNLDIR